MLTSEDRGVFLYTKCIAFREEVLGEKRPDTLESMRNLAGLYHHMQRYDEALPLCTKCLALREEVLGEKHPDAFRCMNYLALLYIYMGRYDEALI